MDIHIRDIYIGFLKDRMKIRNGYFGRGLEYQVPNGQWAFYDDIWAGYMLLREYVVSDKDRR